MMASGRGRHFVRYQLPAIIWALLIFVSSSIPGKDFPDIKIPNLDKVVHFAYYFVFAFLVARAFRYQSRFPDLSRFSLILSFVLAGAYGVSDEVHQLFVTDRSSDPQDLMADITGALVAVLVLAVMKRARDPEARRKEDHGGTENTEGHGERNRQEKRIDNSKYIQ